MGLSIDSSVGGGGQLAQAVVEALLGEDDADVGRRRLGEDTGDVAGGQLVLEPRGR
ncbi:MAG: hypothetical protein U0R26_05310 [Solirubrobacterales bacterium]